MGKRVHRLILLHTSDSGRVTLGLLVAVAFIALNYEDPVPIRDTLILFQHTRICQLKYRFCTDP